ncbi:MAG: HAMP domain-containing sensor histidine kinase [Bacteroidota bacterium]
MKLNRTYLFIGISSLALLMVLVIQVNWIYEAADVKEKIFNEKANMVLSKTADALTKDTSTVKSLKNGVSVSEKRKIDSLFNYYMKAYNIEIKYSFSIKPFVPTFKNEATIQNELKMNPGEGCYQTCVTETSPESGKGSVSKNGIDLQLVFPDKDEFIMAEMGIPFISSVLLIVIVLITFWRTALSLMKEKQISEHTTDFLNNMTHEFKTPLTNISLAGKMMVKDANINQEDKVRHYSGIILEENEKLRLQVEQVLSMTALERGEIPLRKTDLDVHQLINDCLKCMSVQIEDKHVRVISDLAAENFVIYADKTHVTNAICNLIDNALKYSSPEPELQIQTFNKDGKFILTVSDNGIGIEEEYQKKVFEKFFRVPTGNVHDVKGFGLGLTYIKSIIEMHGGSIELQSETGKGTVFIIRLPHV